MKQKYKLRPAGWFCGWWTVQYHDYIEHARVVVKNCNGELEL